MLKLTEETTIKRTSQTRTRKPKTSQIPFALLLTVAIVAFGYYIGLGNTKLSVYWAFGIIFGFVLQRSRFCFTAAFRDPCITGSTSVTRAVLVAVGLASIGFGAIKLGLVFGEADATKTILSGVAPIGLPLFLGAILFGIGMVIAGGCASGTLMRVGEGFVMQLLSFVFFVIGSFIGAGNMGFWNKFNQNAPKIFLPDIFGWFGAVVVQLAIIVLLYIAAVKWQQKKMGSSE